MTSKRVDELQVGDVVHAIGAVTFTEPHTVTHVDTVALGGKRRVVSVKATGGCFWPCTMMGGKIATVAA